MRIRNSALVGTALLASAAPIFAAEFQIAGDAGIGRSNNITRSAADERSATIRSLGLLFSLSERTRRVDLSATGDLSFLDYAGQVYDSEVTGSALGRVRLGLVEEHLAWVVEDNFGQTRQDLFSAPNPANRENVNYFSTGPDVSLPVGPTTDVILQGRAALVDYQQTPADSKRLSYLGAVERQLSGGGRLSLNVSNEQIDGRDGSLTPSYDRGAAYLRYALSGSRTSLSVDVGGNRVHGEVQTASGAMLRLALGRSIGTLSRVTLTAGRQLTDSGNSLAPQAANQLPPPNTGAGALTQEAQPFVGQHVNLAWAVTGRFSTLGFSAGIADENYGGGPGNDRQLWQLSMEGTRQFGPRAQVTAEVRFNSSDYDLQPGDNHELGYEAALHWRIGRRLGLVLSGEHFTYYSNLVAGKAAETRLWLRLRYGNDASTR